MTKREIKIVDQTFRDAPQSLWAARMTTAMRLAVAEQMDRIGFDSLDLMGSGSGLDVAVRYLKEDPWERLRLIRAKMPNTPIVFAMRSRNDVGFRIAARDIQFLWIERFLANGMRRFRVFDPLQDLDNTVPLLNYAKSLGAFTVGALAFGYSPVHTDELYVAKAKELIERANVDQIMLKDAGALLTPERVKTLVPALKAVMGKMPLEVHTHCMTGLGPLVCHEAVKAGAELVHTSIAPLANGNAQPAMQTMVRNLREMGYAVNTDDRLMEEISRHFAKVAEQEGKPIGKVAEYDAFHYEHQLPGGMISNFRSQLTEHGLSDKMPAIMEEAARIRGEIGWPIMITPFAQIVGTQALLNIVHGERYRVVSDELKRYVLGYNGKLLSPVAPDVLDKIIENGSPSISHTPEETPPAVDALRKKYPNASDEERLLRYAYVGSQVDDMLAAGPAKRDYVYEQPVEKLLREIANRPRIKHIFIEKNDFKLQLDGV